MFSPQFQNFATQLVTKKSEYSQDLSEYHLIQQQSDLINELMKNYCAQKKHSSISTQPSDFSMETTENPHHFNISFSGINFAREQSRFFEQQSLEEALKQIKAFCSRKTYSFVRDKFKTTQDNRKDYRLQKQIRYNQQLMKRCMKFNHEVIDLKTKLEAAQKPKREELKSPRSQNINLLKGQAFLKWEISMVYKQKMHAELKKNLNRQFAILGEEKKLNEAIRQEIKNFLAKVHENGDNYGTEIQQLFQSIRLTVEQQRNLSKKQEQDYRKMQQQLQSIINQLRCAVGMF